MSISTRVTPVQANERIQVVDVLRGFAILGILLMNMRGFSGQGFYPSGFGEALDRNIVILIDFFAQAKFYSLFSFLFGWGMAMQMGRAQSKGVKFIPLYMRRLIVLFVFGGLHAIFLWNGDILTMYAVLGMVLLLLFSKRSERTLLIAFGVSIVTALVMTLPGETMEGVRIWCRSTVECLRPDNLLPQSLYTNGSYIEVTRLRFQEYLGGFWWVPCHFGSVFAMMLLGLYTGKQKIFENIELHLPLIRKVMWIGLAIGLPLNGVFVYGIVHPYSTEYGSFIRTGARIIGAPALTLFYITAIILFFRTENGKQRLAPLSFVGRMALTNYISHSIIAPLIFNGYGLGLYGETDPTFGLLLTIIIYLSQIRFSQWWFEHYQIGPLEWLWRTLSYAMWHPFSAASSYDSLSHLDKQSRRRRTLTTTLILVAVISGSALLANKLIDKPVDEVAELGTPSNEVTAANNNEQSNDDESTSDGAVVSVGTPVVKPVNITPGEIASTGDMQALSQTFNAEQAYIHIQALADTSLEGRLAGSKGGYSAGNYISEKFDEFGLQPVGDNGSFFQQFPITSIQLDDAPYLGITTPNGSVRDEYRQYMDFKPVIGSYAGAGAGKGQVIWVVDCEPKDFRNLNVVGKIVLCHAGDVRQITRLAVENGAAGLLLLADEDSQRPDFREAPLPTWIPEPIPVYYIYPNVAQDILDGSEYSVSDLSITFTPVELTTQVDMRVSISETCQENECKGRNVVGVIPGTDPAYADQVLILSANYDHVGKTSDEMIWQGANGNASGVSVLLEIAHSWQEQGYVPKVTTLFVAWDAEEQGSLGARHYIQHPIYPLDKTVTVIQLDKVGAGNETLHIDGIGFAETAMLYANGLEVETAISDNMNGAHRTFINASVPAYLLSWGGTEQYAYTPIDTPEIIQLEKLEQAGYFTNLITLGAVDSRSEINELLARRAEAITQADLTTFLSTSTAQRQDGDQRWFIDAQSLDLVSCELTPLNINVVGNSAQATIEMRLNLPTDSEDEETRTIVSEMPVLFTYTTDGWKWDGADLIRSDAFLFERTQVTVYSPPNLTLGDRFAGEETSIEEFAQNLAEKYSQVATTLNLSTNANIQFYLYAKGEHLRADTSPALPAVQAEWVGKDTIKILFTPEINDDRYLRHLLVRAVLTNAGIPQNSFTWIWDGLPLLLDGKDDPVKMQTRMLPSLTSDLSEESQETSTAESSWAALEYLRYKFGWDGLGRFIRNLGQACQSYACETDEGADQALLTTINLNRADFDLAWRYHWQTKLTDAQSGLDEVLAQRTEAVNGGDEASFLQTVDRQIPNLVQEERTWFADLSVHPLESFVLTAKPTAFLDDGSILALVEMDYQLENVSGVSGKGKLPLSIRFLPTSGGYLWSGPWLQTTSTSRIVVRYPQDQQELAESMLAEADTYYAQLAAAMNSATTPRLTINLYNEPFEYRSLVALSFSEADWLPGWSEQGHSIKLLTSESNDIDEYRPALIEHLARQILQQRGVNNTWLLTGASVYHSRNIANGIVQQKTASYLYALDRALQDEKMFDLADFPDPQLLSEDRYKVAKSQAWDSVSYLVNTYGEDALLDLISYQRSSLDMDTALRLTTGLTLSEFDTAWRNSLTTGHLSASQIETVSNFDITQAQKHLDYLTSPELAGRQAGSSGSELAAAYIAEGFASYGLTVEQQAFPVPYQTYIELPILDVIKNGNVENFIYRDDFIVIQSVDTNGTLSGDLIWVADENYTNMELDGKVVVRKPTLSIETEIENARLHGASALILIGEKHRSENLDSKYPFAPPLPQGNIPVFEFTPQSFNKLLELTDQTQEGLFGGLPVTHLNVSVNFDISLSEYRTAETVNVIGLLPGSNPELQDEYIVIGAHYDFVGDEVNIPYRGANDNAGGVAVLMEIARLWQDSNYRPQRSVVFVAWGAQEPGELGSQYFVENPLYPIENIAATIQLDSIGGGDGYFLEALGTRSEDALLLFNMQKASEITKGRLRVTVPESIDDTAVDELFSPSSLYYHTDRPFRADDQTFRRLNIPTLLLMWQKSDETNLPDDIADEVLPERLEAAGRMITATLMMIAR